MPNRPEFQINYPPKPRGMRSKGVLRQVRANKRAEAEARNSNTPELKKRSHWRSLGFHRESEASRIVRETVLESNAIAESVRARSGQDDWAEDYDPATVQLLAEVFASEAL